MSEKGQNDFFSQTFRLLNSKSPWSLSNRLKKKFLKKQNFPEETDRSARCNFSDVPEFEALNWLKNAKFHRQSGRSDKEADALIKAAHFFLQSPNHTLSAIDCFSQAEQLLAPKDKNDYGAVAGALCTEAGVSLKSASPHTSVTFLSKAVVHLSNAPSLQIIAQGELASVQLMLGNYHAALSLYSDVVDTVKKLCSTGTSQAFNDLLISCEISRTLLILLLRPSPQKISPNLAKLVEKYTWIGEPDMQTTSWLGEELFFLLQSLVMACQCQDLEAVHSLEEDLSKYFTNEQKDLLQALINDIINTEK